jgi:DNA-binding response OmpR family regulator
MASVLFVSDDLLFSASISSLLTTWGYNATGVSSAQSAYEAVASRQPSAAIIDSDLPDSVDAIDLCRNLRDRSSELGIIFSFSDDRAHRVLTAFSTGADDCIAKTASEGEFHARLDAIVRRSDALYRNRLYYGSFELEPMAGIAKVRGTTIELTPTQFRMLDYLLRNQGRAISAKEFKQVIFRSAQSIDSTKLRVHICELRRRLGSVGHIIESVRGKGYGVGISGV